jgi:dihydroorotate dehydrogenase
MWNPLLRRAIYWLEPEQAHHLAIWALEHGLGGNYRGDDDPVLRTSLCGLDFPNPVGLAAGFDKDARAISGSLNLGFGFIEAGTVTPLPQPGNPKPRLFRLDEDEGVINRFGFNSEGLVPFVGRFAKYKKIGSRQGIAGANVGKNKTTEDGAADYVQGIEALAPIADYLVVNLSSPNTPGLRTLQTKSLFLDLLRRVLAKRDEVVASCGRRPPLFAKVGPDLTDEDIEDIVATASETGVDGLIIGNTTVERPDTLRSRWRQEAGGLSGAPLTALANTCLAKLYRASGGRIPIIGCGGIASGADAYARIRAGATLVQIYSALVFHGPPLVSRIKRELAALLKRDGFDSVAQAVGADNPLG